MIDNRYPKPGEQLCDHPIAQIFPMMAKDESESLVKSIKEAGLREDIVLLDGKILDGRNRYEACREAKIEPRYRFFDYLKDGASPVLFVMDKNAQRRHLSAGQRATIASEALSFFEAEAKERQQKTHFKPSLVLAEFNEELGVNGDNGTKPEAPKKTEVKKSVTQAAKVMGVGKTSVAQAKKLKEDAPEKFEAVKNGAKSLNAAIEETKQDANKAAAAGDTELAQAYQRISNICGNSLAEAAREGLRLKGKKEVLAFAALDDDMMLRLRGLIQEGWTVAKAQAYKAQQLCRTHRIGDLINRAAANPAMPIFTLEIDGWEITVARKGTNAKSAQTNA